MFVFEGFGLCVQVVWRVCFIVWCLGVFFGGFEGVVCIGSCCSSECARSMVTIVQSFWF